MYLPAIGRQSMRYEVRDAKYDRNTRHGGPLREIARNKDFGQNTNPYFVLSTLYFVHQKSIPATVAVIKQAKEAANKARKPKRLKLPC